MPLSAAGLAELLASRSPPPSAAIPMPVDAAAARYVAALAMREAPPPPPRVHLPAFFSRARAHAAEARALAEASALADPREVVGRHEAAFLVSRVIWSKCDKLMASDVGAVFGVDGVGVRDVWLLYLVAKSLLRMDMDVVKGSDVHAYHLLHAVLLVLGEGAGAPAEAGAGAAAASGTDDASASADVGEGRRKRAKVWKKVDALCSATGALSSEVVAYQRKLRQVLPESIKQVLPVGVEAGGANPRAAAAAFEAEYQRLLDSPEWPAFIDERVFVDAPLLVVPLDDLAAGIVAPAANDDEDVRHPRNAAASAAAAAPASAAYSTPTRSTAGCAPDGHAADNRGAGFTSNSPSTPVAPGHNGARNTGVAQAAAGRIDGDGRGRGARASSSAAAGGGGQMPPVFPKHVRDDVRAAVRRVAGNGDALDTLAALASGERPSPRVVPQFRAPVPLSPGAAALTEAMEEHRESARAVAADSARVQMRGAVGGSLTTPIATKRLGINGAVGTPSGTVRRLFPVNYAATDAGQAPGAGGLGLPAVAQNTPMMSSLAAVNWLHRIADTRPETAQGLGVLLGNKFGCSEKSGADDIDDSVGSRGEKLQDDGPPCGLQVQTSATLAPLKENHPEVWKEIINRLRYLCDRLAGSDGEEQNSWSTAKFVREACGLYFKALDNVYVSESKRLEKVPYRVTALMRSVSFHKSLLVCALESTSAAYGNRRMEIVPVLLPRFGLTPFDLSKCTETFVVSFKDLPPSVKRHIVNCEHRLLESIVWAASSPLVECLAIRSASSDWEALPPPHALQLSGAGATEKEESPSSKKDYSEGKPGGRTENIGQNAAPGTSPSARNDPGNPSGGAPSTDGSASAAVPSSKAATDESANNIPATRRGVPEAALELFYLKFLAIASDRTFELLSVLGIELIGKDVWEVIKYCVWDKWRLLVGRHLDQIILSAVYGVAKVRHCDLTFKHIIKRYRRLTHVTDPSFRDLDPGTFRSVSLSPDTNLATEGSGQRGDIIRFYNQVFIHATKGYLLSFSPEPDGGCAPATPNGAEASLGESPFPRSGAASDAGRYASCEKSSPTPSTGATTNQAALVSPDGRRGNPLDTPGRAVEGKVDRLRQAVMQSPLRASKRPVPSKRVGCVMVSPMTKESRALANARRNSPAGDTKSGTTGGAEMTPATRRLFNFGESPSRSLEKINRALSNGGFSQGQGPLCLNMAETPERFAKKRKQNSNVAIHDQATEARGFDGSGSNVGSSGRRNGLPPGAPHTGASSGGRGDPANLFDTRKRSHPQD